MARSNRRTLDDGAEVDSLPHDHVEEEAAPQPAPTPVPNEINDDVDALGDTEEPRAEAQVAAGPEAAPRPLSRRELRQRARQARQEARADAPRDPVVREMDRQDGEAIKDWIQAVTAGQPQFKVTVTRREPTSHRGMRVSGLLRSFDYAVDEDYLQQEFGGGKFTLGVQRRSPEGNWRHLKATQIEIAGDPRIDNLKNQSDAPTPPPADKTGDTIVSKALDALTQQRPAPTGPDLGMLQHLIAPYQAQVTAANKQVEAAMGRVEQLSRELLEVRSAPSDPAKDRFVDKLIDQDSARIAAIRTQHESEMRITRENAREDLKREHDRHDREISMTRQGFEREIASLKEAHLRELATVRQGYENQLANVTTHSGLSTKIHESENKRLERENERLGKELAELRAKKDQSPAEKIKELKGLKELFDDSDDDDEKGILDKVVNSPIAGALFEKLSKVFGDQQQAAAPQQTAFPPGVPYQLNGRTFINDATGQPRPVRRRAPQQQQAQQPATGTEGSAPVTLDMGDVTAATKFMEGAFQAGTEPGPFASSIRNMVPAPVLQQLAALGVDDFLDKVAQLDPASPLRTQQGRNWARKVGKALVGSDD